MQNTFYCGAAKADYTPEMSMLPVKVFTPGNNRPLVGILGHTYVRVIVLYDGKNKIVMASYDMPAAPDTDDSRYFEITPAIPLIAGELNIPEENVFAVGTHAHSAPRVGDLRPDASEEERRFNDYFSKRVYDATLTAVREADAAMKPARVGAAIGQSYINVNRDTEYYASDFQGTRIGIGVNPAGISDKTLFTLRFEELDGTPIAFYINYAVHGVAMMCNTVFEDGVGISPDIGGTTAQEIEKRFSGSVAMWAPAPCGDQNPALMTVVYYPDPETGMPKEEPLNDSNMVLKTMVTRHLYDIYRTLDKIKSTDCDEAPELKSAVKWSVTPGRRPVFAGGVEIPRFHPGMEFAKLPKPIGFTSEGTKDVRIRLQLLKIGDYAIIGSSGELYTSFGLALKAASPYKYTCVSELCATRSPSYVRDDEYIARQEALGNPFASNMAPGYIKDSLVKCASELFEETK